jgi:hypothetical protein
VAVVAVVAGSELTGLVVRGAVADVHGAAAQPRHQPLQRLYLVAPVLLLGVHVDLALLHAVGHAAVPASADHACATDMLRT